MISNHTQFWAVSAHSHQVWDAAYTCALDDRQFALVDALEGLFPAALAQLRDVGAGGERTAVAGEQQQARALLEQRAHLVQFAHHGGVDRVARRGAGQGHDDPVVDPGDLVVRDQTVVAVIETAIISSARPMPLRRAPAVRERNVPPLTLRVRLYVRDISVPPCTS